MPMDDALVLMSKKFEDYRRELVREKAAPPPVAPSPAAHVPPPAPVAAAASRPTPSVPDDFLPPSPQIHYLLNLLSDNRFLNVEELDSIISYLSDRRKRLVEKKGECKLEFRRSKPRDQDRLQSEWYRYE